jgi:hypothetical protein
MTSHVPQFGDIVNTADGDTVPSVGVCLPWASARGEVLSITDGVLRVTAPGEVMLLRNGSPTALQTGSHSTLFSALSFDSNVYHPQILLGNTRLQLKWSDVIIVKDHQDGFHGFHSAFRSGPPSPLEDVMDTWAVYVCLPEFHGGPEAYNALRMPGVCRSIREKVEAFVSIWDAEWDSTAGRVVLSRNGPRQLVYEARKWDALEQHTAGVALRT